MNLVKLAESRDKLLGKLEGMLEICMVIRGYDNTEFQESFQSLDDIDFAIDNVKRDIQDINEKLGLGTFDGIEKIFEGR